MARPKPVSIPNAIAGLTFFSQRTPTTTADESAAAFAEIAGYRDCGVFVGHWAGTTEWERHSVADELVMVLDGATTIFFLDNDSEEAAPLAAGDVVIVPRGTWHRFETPHEVSLMSVTPQPTDHSSTTPL
jgi:mannose-6-phosphate isomerase-like protein (cupin superfamily)